MSRVYNRIHSYITSKFVSDGLRKIGIEEESIVYTFENKRIPVNPGNEFSAVDLLRVLNKKIDSNGYYSLEPGGQIEWSSKPFSNLNDLQESMNNHHLVFEETISEHNLKMVPYGVDPKYSPDDIELIEEPKYQIMDKVFGENGTKGSWMMKNTASIQVNIDIINSKDLEEMVYLADCLHPIAAYLFANSPFSNNKKTGYQNIRNIIWEETDSFRCRNLFDHGIFKPKDLLQNYIEFTLKVPSMFEFDKNRNIVKSSTSIGDLLGKLEESESINEDDIKVALHQIFTNVRLKNVVEIRGADRTPFNYEMAPIAFWTGILTDLNIRKDAIKVCSNWTKNDRKLFNDASLSLNSEQPGPEGKMYIDWIKWAGDLSVTGLKNRKLKEETLFEDFYNNIIQHGPFSIQKQNNETGLDT